MPKLIAAGLSYEAYNQMVLPGTSLDSVRSRKSSTGKSNKNAPLLQPDVATMPADKSSNPLVVSYTHLVVVCHGAMGWPAHVANLCSAIQSSLGPSALVIAPACFSGFRTLTGTQTCGDSVFAEIQAAKATHHSTLTHLSLLGYSFGGILCRWICGRLYEHDFLGLTPCNFVTIACPHLGVVEDSNDVHDDNDDNVATSGSAHTNNQRNSWSSALVQFFVSHAGGATGEELSQSAMDRRALLSWMADPVSPFYQGLKAFEKRSLYASLRGDRTVSFYTAYFPSDDECDARSDDNDYDGSHGSSSRNGSWKTKHSSGSNLRSESNIALTCAPCQYSSITPGYVKPSALGAALFPHVFQWQQRLSAQRPQGVNGGVENGNRGKEGQGGSSEEWKAASTYDALPLLVMVKITGVVLFASPFLVLWLGVVLPTFTMSRWFLRRVLGPASPLEYPGGLASPCQLDVLQPDVSGAQHEAGTPSTTPRSISGVELSAASIDKLTTWPLASLPAPPRRPQVLASPRSHATRVAMAKHLNALEWHKHVAVFSYARDGLAAVHTHAPILFRGANHAAGRDVVLHIAKSLIAAPPLRDL